MTGLVLDDLVVRFRERSRKRLQEMAMLLEVMGRYPGFEEAIDRLLRHFHGMAGLGATYGFPEISRLADEGEALLGAVSQAGRGLLAEELEQLQSLVALMRRELE